MGAGADAAVHHGEEYAAPAEALDHLLAADACAIGLEKYQIGFGLLHLHARDLRKSARQRARIGVIVCEPVDMVVERIGASGRADAGLAHRAAEPLLPAPDLVDEIAAACDDGANRRTQPLGKIDPGGIPAHGHVACADTCSDAGVQQPGAVHVGGKPIGLCDLYDLVEGCLLPDCAAADIGGLFDADHGLRRLVPVSYTH